MKKKLIIAAAAVILAAATGTAVFLKATDNQLIAPTGYSYGKKVVSKTVCYAYNYDTIEGITYASDLIAVARVQSAKLTGDRSDFAETAFTMTVTEPIYNSQKDETFIIKMEGGETLTTVYKVEGEPLMNVGDEVLVFCKMKDDGTYYIINGAQGRLLFENGRLNPLTSENTDGITDGTYSPLIVDNENAEELIEEIKEFSAFIPAVSDGKLQKTP